MKKILLSIIMLLILFSTSFAGYDEFKGKTVFVTYHNEIYMFGNNCYAFGVIIAITYRNTNCNWDAMYIKDEKGNIIIVPISFITSFQEVK